jgi:hypothetical protein
MVDTAQVLGELGTVEQLRLALSPGWVTLALAARTDPDLAEARVVLGLEPRAVHDAEPACDWCGRSKPPAGLFNMSGDGPPQYECNDTDDCLVARAKREPLWISQQYPSWQVDWQKYRQAEAARYQMMPQWGNVYQRASWELTSPAGAGRAGAGAPGRRAQPGRVRGGG